MAFNLSKLNQAVEEGKLDQTKIKGGFERRVPAAGVGWARFVSYIEFGKQKQRPYQGKPKPDTHEVQLDFELHTPPLPKADPPHPGHIREIEVDGEKKKVPDMLSVRLTVSGSEKSKFQKLFKAMRRGRDIKHVAQMLGEAFLVTITHNKSEKNDRVYANIYGDGQWAVAAPQVTNAVDGSVVKVPVPAPASEIRGFLFDMPSQEDWDTLFIDGEREVEVDGKKVTRSNNFLQERILAATNFKGSAVETMLSAKGIDFSKMLTEQPDDDGVETTTEDDDTPGKVEEPKQAENKASAEAPAEEGAQDDEAAALAALGLA